MSEPSDPAHSDARPDSRAPATPRKPVSRRAFLRGAGGVAAGGVLARSLIAAEPATGAGAPKSGTGAEVERLSGEIEITLDVNGAATKVKVEPRTTLLNALRNHCDPALTGTKLVCDRGQCGACTVIVDGRAAYACMLLAADVRGKKIRTIEGLGTPDALSPLQESFWKRDASMCGFCTPGFVMAIQACLEKNPGASLDEIKAGCSGNVCRCGTYPQIFKAAVDAARTLASSPKGAK